MLRFHLMFVIVFDSMIRKY